MQFKPRIKPKLLLKRATAFLTATATLLSVTTTSLAWTGKPGSYTSKVVDQNADIRYNYDKVSWRVSLYVATTDDGKIALAFHR